MWSTKIKNGKVTSFNCQIVIYYHQKMNLSTHLQRPRLGEQIYVKSNPIYIYITIASIKNK